MSDVIVKIIPKDPKFVPSEMKLGEVKEWINFNVSNEKTEYILTDEVRFIDQGENFESIGCPFCSSNIDLDWWGEVMDKASKTSFHNLSVVTDCCNEATSLNELNYKWNAGFSRFSIEIMNPREELTIEHTEYLMQLMGCKIKKVVAFY
ncbi:hypothetical protein [Paenibacillus radicis (ex Xue et al. 2023)]|uniref:Uncharacterized protein n=1 Tax=Paenibacillus radicis (ex Xue et al. 2023) TaxID=2972489 RepID=A0ABT1YNE3_9BACL|nr:hypothetical protein [Paenibacillus radicis (ex Xue et al. 2023)]MCR8633914.1 hypothetical protein [Paenibacillus radicis (ex Xue et al. 2023)]